MDKIFEHCDLKTLEKLSKIVKDNELSEITLVDGEKSLTIKGKKCTPPPMPMAMGMGMPAMQVAPAVSTDDCAKECASVVSGNQVKAPIVGTYYSSPSPDDKPFVTVGQQVKKGETIFIIESMKVMSEVQSDFDGVVKEINVCNGDQVEFDQTLMIIG